MTSFRSMRSKWRTLIFRNLFWILFSFKGRLNRKGYLLGYALCIPFLGLLAHYSIDFDAHSLMKTLIALVLLGPPLVSCGALVLKRVHDAGINALLLLWLYIPLCFMPDSLSKVFAIIWTSSVVVIGLLPSQKKSNKYGDPYTALFPPKTVSPNI